MAKNSKAAEFVLISLDSEHDTVEDLSAFKRSHKLDGPKWHLLVGADDDVRKLAILLGYSYQRTNNIDDQIVHSNKIVLLDRDGVQQFTLEGLNSDIEELAKRL